MDGMYNPALSATEDVVGEPRKLYSPVQVALAAFLGTPIAGCWLLAKNFVAMEKPEAGRKTLLLGAGATVVLFVVAFMVPKGFPNAVLPAVYTGLMRRYAKDLQGRDYARHVEAGGAKQSSWRAAGIGLASLAIVLAILFVGACILALMSPSTLPSEG